jgi:methyltransferase (TIGR00027 family)
MLVAMARALADDGFTTVPAFRDPVARQLLSPQWAWYLRLSSGWQKRTAPEKRARAMAQLDAIILRVAAIDAEIEAAVAAGCRQLVVLGAGLDTRAFRLDALAGVDVFEVDHPATQAYKRRAAGSLRPRAKSMTFVAVNFERDSLEEGLRAAGFRSHEPAAWAWEGVVMYLTDEAVRGTLADIARSSRQGSVLVINYHEPETGAASRERRLSQMLLSFWREPQIGLRTRETMQAEVRRAGFDVVSDTPPSEWAARLGAEQPAGRTARISRLLVARRRAPS